MSGGARGQSIGERLRRIVVAGLVGAGVAVAGLTGTATTIACGAWAAEETPYDDLLAELAETLGALHLLRPLCGAPEAQTWRDQMHAVLESV
ncbi:MAG: TIGR02301 family protein, partial [Phyllobacteriaceae bacterium]|nr:TIGR02301 family protein [Phyllobacteriaceae bacterium]